MRGPRVLGTSQKSPPFAVAEYCSIQKPGLPNSRLLPSPQQIAPSYYLSLVYYQTARGGWPLCVQESKIKTIDDFVATLGDL